MAARSGEVRGTGGVIRALAAGCVGNVIEWYDFAVYLCSVAITVPIVATSLISVTGSDVAPTVYLIVVALMVLSAVFLLPETRSLSLVRGADRSGAETPEVGRRRVV